MSPDSKNEFDQRYGKLIDAVSAAAKTYRLAIDTSSLFQDRIQNLIEPSLLLFQNRIQASLEPFFRLQKQIETITQPISELHKTMQTVVYEKLLPRLGKSAEIRSLLRFTRNTYEREIPIF